MKMGQELTTDLGADYGPPAQTAGCYKSRSNREDKVEAKLIGFRGHRNSVSGRWGGVIHIRRRDARSCVSTRGTE
jgi:hypothetical protein